MYRLDLVHLVVPVGLVVLGGLVGQLGLVDLQYLFLLVILVGLVDLVGLLVHIVSFYDDDDHYDDGHDTDGTHKLFHMHWNNHSWLVSLEYYYNYHHILKIFAYVSFKIYNDGIKCFCR